MKSLKELLYGKDYEITKDPYWKWLVLLLLVAMGFFYKWFWILAILQAYYTGKKSK